MTPSKNKGETQPREPADPSYEDCVSITTAEGRMRELHELVDQFAPSANTFTRRMTRMREGA